MFFLVSATKRPTDPVDEFNEWDFRRRQNTLGIVNQIFSISGAVFTPTPAVVLVKALRSLWTSIFYPGIPQINPKPLNQILDHALFELNDLYLRIFQHECADIHLFSHWKQMLKDKVAEVFQSHQIFTSNLGKRQYLLIMFLNKSLQNRILEKRNTYKRSLLVPIAGTALGANYPEFSSHI